MRSSRSNTCRLELVKYWHLLGVLLLVAVAMVSLVPLADVGVSDKLSHLVTYFILASWFSLLVDRPIVLLAVAAGLIGYGTVIELLQGLTTYRDAEWGDLIANGGGILAGIGCYFSPLRRLLMRIDARLVQIIQR